VLALPRKSPVSQDHCTKVVPVADDTTKRLIHSSHRCLNVPFITIDASHALRALVHELPLDHHLWVSLHCEWDACDNRCSARVIAEVETLARFASANSKKDCASGILPLDSIPIVLLACTKLC
jgi:hypothetical protein